MSLPSSSIQGIPEWITEPTVVSASASMLFEDESLGLSPWCQARLLQLGFTEAFAVQSAVIPFLTNNTRSARIGGPVRDLCVSAPTGSGKTLAYAVPIVEALSKRRIIRLRALVVVPTRELAAQVRDIFEALVKGTDLKVVTATGQHSFKEEQRLLVQSLTTHLIGGSSRVDILVATPGRLVDHITSTANFTLQHLSFLVIDEADRLLNQSFHDWLAKVFTAIDPLKTNVSLENFAVDDIGLPHPDASAHRILHRPNVPLPSAHRLQKLLFSATLTRNPEKIASLRLERPCYITVKGGAEQSMEKFSTPASLKEFMAILSSSSDKPLLLLQLLFGLGIRSGVLCFCKSIDSAKRLSRLLTLYSDEMTARMTDGDAFIPLSVADFSGNLTPVQRQQLLKQFDAGEINVLICSDIVARGLDLDTIKAVISYDCPPYIKTYVHRVGRTGRAGREGIAYTIVEPQEAKPFKDVLAKSGHTEKVKRYRWKDGAFNPYRDAYEAALAKLQLVYKPQWSEEQKNLLEDRQLDAKVGKGDEAREYLQSRTFE